MIVLFQGRGGCHLDLLPRGPSGHDCRLLFPYHCGDARILWNREKKPAASCMGMVFLSPLYCGRKDQPVVDYFSSVPQTMCFGDWDSSALTRRDSFFQER